MAKAITEVAVGAAAFGLAVAMPGIGMGLAWMTLGMQNAIVGSLVGIGGSSVMAGLSDALKGNQGGIAVAVTSPVGPWAYIYGTQKVGGVEIFRQSNSSQGTSNNKELHRVYALDCHPSVGDQGPFQLRIDGKQVLLTRYGAGWSSYSPGQIQAAIISMSRDVNGLVTVKLAVGINGLDGTSIQITEAPDNNFNGIWIVTQPNSADNTTFQFICGGAVTTITGGQFWTLFADYKDKIYVEFLNGNHTSTFQGLLASGTNWSASDLCLGHTLVYVRMGYDASVFPSSIPNVSFVIQGKNDILDPRTGSKGYTENPALCIADYLSLPSARGGFGLAIGTDIPTAQLIAAANICDEQVPLADGGTAARYTCNTFFMLNSGRGTILKQMLSSCAGRISFQGGQYSIFPAGWLGPTLQLTDADLVGPIKWTPRFSIRDTCNAVKGTYVSPENAYQQADVPAYMQDADHGYVSDPWLAEDNGERIYREANFPCTDNSAEAQRLEKVGLLRTRYQGRGTIRCSMRAYQGVALDVIQLTHPRYTWLNKDLEVLNSRFVVDKGNGAPTLAAELDVAETSPDIYDWSITEQLTPQGYKQPDNVGNSVCCPPEDVVIYSGPGATINGITFPSTITTGADGSVQVALYVAWTQPNDANVVQGGHLEVQWQPAGATVWTAWGKLDPSASHCFINGVTYGQQYNVQVRAVNCVGVPSVWMLAGPEGASWAVGVGSYSGIPDAPPGTLSGMALLDGTAKILVASFTSIIDSKVCTPNPAVLAGLNQDEPYYVYYVDAAFAGGTIVPIATQNQTDFLNKAGYLLIGSITTPSTGGVIGRPSACSAFGSLAITNPANAYDTDPATCAVIGALGTGDAGTPPDIKFNSQAYYYGFPPFVLTSSATLTVTASTTAVGSVCSVSIIATVDRATWSTLLSTAVSTAKTAYTLAVPVPTTLSNVQINVVATCSSGTGAASLIAVNIYDIKIQ